MPDLDDKRKLKRRHLIYYLRVFDKVTGALLGHLVDVTPEGILIMHEKPIEEGKTFSLRMDLPMEIWGDSHLDFDALSVHTGRDPNPDFLNTGFKLSNVDWKVLEAVERLISAYGFKD